MLILSKLRGAFLIAYIRVFSLLFALLLLLSMFYPLSSPAFAAGAVGGAGVFFFCVFYLRARMGRYRCVFTSRTIEVRSGLYNTRRTVLRRSSITYVTWAATPLQALFHLGTAIITYPGAIFVMDCISKEDFLAAFSESSPERRGDA